MEKNIKHFQDITVRVLEKAQVHLFENPEQFSEFIELIHKRFDNLACKFIQETLEAMNELIRNNARRKQYWYVEKYSRKQLIISFGTVQFKKTLYRKKDKSEMTYLLDTVLNLNKHERITEDALVEIIE